MSELLINRDEWVVVCDGAKALVLQNLGDTKFPNLKTIKVFEQKDLATHELGADAPGRAFSPASHGSRGTIERTAWHDHAVRDIAILDQMHENGPLALDVPVGL